VNFLNDEVKVTRKYQVTIPEGVRSKLGVKIGDKLSVKTEDNRIVMETAKHVSNPSDILWNLFGRPIDIDAVRLVEASWKEIRRSQLKRTTVKQKKAKED
jgi:AbrB family looped-hinge helix DNA binding protein